VFGAFETYLPGNKPGGGTLFYKSANVPAWKMPSPFQF
jgi:hypothetical protein